MPDRIESLDALALAARYRSGALSPVEVARDALARIARFEPEINAFAHLDEALTLDMARRSEARWRADAPLGALDGAPVTIKDNLAVEGWPTRRGSAVSSSEPSAVDSPAAGRLRAAGAVFLGKTTMPEFGWKGTGDSPLTGVTRNPWNLALTPGGSSSGAAAAAALNLGVVHLGTDAAGSVRIPAAFTGVFALKPSHGRVPAEPVSTMGFLAHIGPIARTVTDAALALEAISGPHARDLTATLPPFDAGDVLHLSSEEQRLEGLRIAFSPRLGGSVEVDDEVAALVERAARRARDLGALLVDADPPIDDPAETLLTIWAGGAALALRPYGAEERARMDPDLVAIAERGERVSAADYADALLYARAALAERAARFHERFDLLLTPTLPLPAFEAGRLAPTHGRYGHDDWSRWTPFTYPFNITGQPAASLPCGLTEAGLPAGLQIVGAHGADGLVLRAARALEAAIGAPRIEAPRGGEARP